MCGVHLFGRKLFICLTLSYHVALLRRRRLERLAAGTQQEVICSIYDVADGDVYRPEACVIQLYPFLKIDIIRNNVLRNIKENETE